MSDNREIEEQAELTFSTESGFQYEVFKDGTTCVLVPESKATDFHFGRKDSIRRLSEIHNVTTEEVSRYYNEKTDQELFEELESELVGYAFGVTARDSVESNEAIPGISEIIKGARSNVLIIANGLSEVATLNRDVAVRVMDRISYRDIVSDFEEMETREPDLYTKFRSQANVAKQICAGNNISPIRHIIGLGVNKLPPNEIGRYQLIVSIYGPTPSKNIIPEFLALAKQGGEIYVDWTPDVIQRSLSGANIPTDSVDVRAVVNSDGEVVASKIIALGKSPH